MLSTEMLTDLRFPVKPIYREFARKPGDVLRFLLNLLILLTRWQWIESSANTIGEEGETVAGRELEGGLGVFG